jgi:hypothetical protein
MASRCPAALSGHMLQYGVTPGTNVHKTLWVKVAQDSTFDVEVPPGEVRFAVEFGVSSCQPHYVLMTAPCGPNYGIKTINGAETVNAQMGMAPLLFNLDLRLSRTHASPWMAKWLRSSDSC